MTLASDITAVPSNKSITDFANTTRELNIDYVLIAEDVKYDEQKKVSIIGIFENIDTKTVPVLLPALSVVVGVSGEPGKRYQAEIFVRHKESNSLLVSAFGDIQINASGNGVVVSEIDDLVLQNFGQYEVVAKLAGHSLSTTFYVRNSKSGSRES